METIGLLGGLGVGAAIHYYRELAAAHDDRRRPMNLVMAHASISVATDHASRGDRQGLASYFAGLLGRLKNAGATVGVVPAVTPHLCIDFIHIAYSDMAHTGSSTPERRDRFVALADTLQKRDGVEAVVLAGTDFAVMFNASNTPFPHLDCCRAHIDAILAAVGDKNHADR